MEKLSTDSDGLGGIFGRPHPLESSLDSLQELDEFVHAHVHSIQYVREMGPVISKQLHQRGFEQHKIDTLSAIVAQVATVADKGRQYLHELIVVRLWTIVEVTVEDILLCKLHQGDWWRTSPATQKIKGSLVEFANLDDEQRMRRLLDELAAMSGSKLRRGVDGFEDVMERLGLGGSLDSNVRTVLMQLAGSRNVIVHKHGVVDKRFVEQCPWVECSVGTRLALGGHEVWLFKNAVMAYIMTLGQRMQTAGLLVDLDNFSFSEFAAQVAERLTRPQPGLEPETESPAE